MADTRIIPPPRDVSTPVQSTSSLGPGAAVSPAASAVSAATTGVSPASALGKPAVIESSDGGQYAALAQRVTLTEQTLAALQAQVAQLAATVKNVLPNSSLPSSTASPQSAPPPSSMGAGRLFSPFDSPVPTSAGGQTRQTGGSGGGSDAQVSQLTQQIAALSTSVAQLQRLQAHNISGPPLSVVPPSPSMSSNTSNNTNGHASHGSNLTQSRHIAPPPPHDQFGGPLSPGGPMLSPGREGFNGSQRPPNRSFQSSLLGDSMDSMWGAPSGGKFGGSSALSASAPQGGGSGQWSTSPNNSNHMPPAGGMSAGSTAPGAGIVVTKWDHLNLKPELTRSISKYG